MEAKDLQKVIEEIRLNKDDEYQLRTVYNCINNKNIDFCDFCVLMTELLQLNRNN